MKIYYLSFSMIPSRKANSIQVMQMCQALAELGNEVLLFCRQGERTGVDPFEYYGITNRFPMHPVRTPDIRILNRLYYAVEVARQLRTRSEPALIYARDRFSAGVIGLVSRNNHPMILEVHAPPQSAFWTWWFGRLIKRPNFVQLVAISEALAAEYLRIFPDLSRLKVLVAHDAATHAADGVTKSGAAVLEKDRLQIGYVGSLGPGKGLEIISQLASLLPECDFLVFGGDEEAVRAWKKKADYPNLTFHGFVDPARTNDCIAGCDIVLAPYQPSVLVGNNADIGRWMSPLKIFEYMSMGKPIVASDLPVLKEVLEDGRNALLAEATNPVDWKEQIMRLAADRPLRQALGENAQRDFRENYTWARRAESILRSIGAVH